MKIPEMWKDLRFWIGELIELAGFACYWLAIGNVPYSRAACGMLALFIANSIAKHVKRKVPAYIEHEKVFP
jgi:hypothetical protein